MKKIRMLLKDFGQSNKHLSHTVQAELVAFLYRQLPLAIIAEVIIALFTGIVLWYTAEPLSILGWMVFLFATATLGRAFIYHCYKFYSPSLSLLNWVRLFKLGVVCSAISWGILGGLLIPDNGLVYQTFIVIILLGITTGANSMYSADREVYALFLLIAFTPLSIWVIFHGGLYFFIGSSAVIYMAVMLVISYNNHVLLRDSIMLRFQNTDLDLHNQVLEDQVLQRTQDLSHSLAVIESTLDSIDYGLIIINLANNISYFNKQFLHMWRLKTLTLNKPLSESDAFFITEQLENPLQYLKGIHEIKVSPERSIQDELKLLNGTIYERFSTPYVVGNEIIGHVWGYRDITKKKEMEERIVHQAKHDALTKLPNRILLLDRIQHDIEIAKRFQSLLAVMFIDLDNFKSINDVLGHQKGDLLLQHTATRLQECVRKSDTVARFGGDEFIILFITKNQKEMTDLCKKIVGAVSVPLSIDNVELHTTASIGLSIYPKHALDSSDLIKKADMAMYKAKKSGGNHFEIYEE